MLVVAPYNAQVSTLKRALAEVEVTRVGTVDKFQGQETPVAIRSCTSSSPEDAPRGMEFRRPAPIQRSHEPRTRHGNRRREPAAL